MSAKTIPAVILFLVSTLLTGCNIYSHYGYGGIAVSQFDTASVTPLEPPANAPSIRQHFRPVGVSAQSGHKGFDMLLSSSAAVLAAAGEVIRVQTPVPCPGLGWSS